MNLRFVFSLIVSLLSLLPAAAQDLTRNWIRERIFLDAEGKECVTSVQYFDGIGRETLLLTDGLSPGGDVAGALTGESFAGRTSAKWLPATGLTGFDFLTPERVKSLAVSSHEGDSVPFSLTRRDALGRVSSVRNAGGDLAGKAKYRYFVRDRLGSVRSVADEDGNVLQQNLYYAWGGAWGDVCTAPGFQSYKYCGKYLDRKHGLDLYDYGARLYDPAAAFWTSPDPLCEKYYNISPYAFCNDNPVTFIDPDGRVIETAWDAANVAMGVTSFVANVTAGNIVGAALDGAGLIIDVAATAIPCVPGGAATAIKAVRGAKIAEKVVKNAAVKSAVRKGVKKIAANFKPYAHHRPKYAKGQVEEVWRRAMDKDGIVKDPYTNEILVWDGKSPRNWDMGHVRGKEYKDLHKRYMDGKISKEEFLREYRNPDNYVPQSRYSNRSHKFEAP